MFFLQRIENDLKWRTFALNLLVFRLNQKFSKVNASSFVHSRPAVNNLYVKKQRYHLNNTAQSVS